MILYMDTSALIKRYVREDGTEEVISIVERANGVGSVILTQVEMAAALAKSVRQGWVQQETAWQAWQDFLVHWRSFARLSISVATLERASGLAWEYGLRGYDAMHFASALAWQEAIDTPVTLATYDRELWTAAQKAGMDVWPEK
jgi:predicted nucleic acid-binding protein